MQSPFANLGAGHRFVREASLRDPLVSVGRGDPGELSLGSAALTPEEFLGRLERVRASGENAWSAACPAHDDRVASLSVGIGREGCVLIHCHSGCAPLDVLDVLNLRPGDLFADDERPRERPVTPSKRPGVVRVPARSVRREARSVVSRARPRVAAVNEGDVVRWRDRLQRDSRTLDRVRVVKGWSPSTLAALGIGFDGRRLTLPVRAPGGDLLGVLRYLPGGEPKMLASSGAPRELWPAPEALPDGPLFLVEGEPDAVSCRELGLSACALPGVGKWADRWIPRLAGRAVVLLGDCDAPGRDAMGRVAAKLAGVANVRVVDLDPSRWDKHDIGDEVTEAVRLGDLGLRALRRRVLGLAGLDLRERRTA